MAERRMFAKSIIDSDSFLDMPLSTQALYFHLAMRADDDGFVNNPKRIQRMIGSSDDELKVLIAKQYILPFESGVVVIKHWRIHNYIQKDRYHPSECPEKSLVKAEKGKPYEFLDTECIQDGNIGKVRLGKSSLGKVSVEDMDGVSDDTPPIGAKPHKPRKQFVPPTLEEVEAYRLEKGYNFDSKSFIEHYEASDWHLGNGRKVRYWKQCCATWENNAKRYSSKQKKQPTQADYDEWIKELEKDEGK